MKTITPNKLRIVLATVLALFVTSVHAGTITDTFGSGANTFNIDFVPIGNAGNVADTTGFGAVPYYFNLGTYEISQAQIDAATASGLMNVTGDHWTGSQPAASIIWYQAAAFVNWLNTSRGYSPAYNLTYNGAAWSMSLWSPAEASQIGGQNLYRNANAHYFLPSENEWYKAAYYDPTANGGAGGYWLYATGSNNNPGQVAGGTAVGTAVYNALFSFKPAPIDFAGGPSPYGTMGQNGNVNEWQESAFDGVNDNSSEIRVMRGGSYAEGAANMQSLARRGLAPNQNLAIYDNGLGTFGFRVASVATNVPEPSSTLLLLGSVCVWTLKRSHRAGL